MGARLEESVIGGRGRDEGADASTPKRYAPERARTPHPA